MITPGCWKTFNLEGITTWYVFYTHQEVVLKRLEPRQWSVKNAKKKIKQHTSSFKTSWSKRRFLFSLKGCFLCVQATLCVPLISAMGQLCVLTLVVFAKPLGASVCLLQGTPYGFYWSWAVLTEHFKTHINIYCNNVPIWTWEHS